MAKFSRLELYDLVWSEPMISIAKQVGFSDVAISKTCQRYDIPVPPRGYWAKLEAGRKVARPPLPLRKPGMPDRVEMGADKWSLYNTPKNLIDMDLPGPPEFDEPIEELTARVASGVGTLKPPKDLSRAHRGILRLLDADAKRRAEAGKHPYSFSMDRPLFDSPFERRRLKVMSTIMNALERNGARTVLRGKDPSSFEATVGMQHFSIEVGHPGETRYGWRTDSDRLLPSNHKLKVEVRTNSRLEGLRLTFEDNEGQRVEDCLSQIVTNTIVAGEREYRLRETGHYEWLKTRKAQLIEEEQKRKEEAERRAEENRRKREQGRIDSLLVDAAAFRQASDIRAYVANVLEAVKENHPDIDRGTFDRWSSWATEQADRIDPVCSLRFLRGREEG